MSDSAADDPYERRARLLRMLATAHRKRAAELDMAAEAALASRSMRKLVEVLTSAEIQEIATHPDLAELNAQMNGWYEDPPA